VYLKPDFAHDLLSYCSGVPFTSRLQWYHPSNSRQRDPTVPPPPRFRNGSLWRGLHSNLDERLANLRFCQKFDIQSVCAWFSSNLSHCQTAYPNLLDYSRLHGLIGQAQNGGGGGRYALSSANTSDGFQLKLQRVPRPVCLSHNTSRTQDYASRYGIHFSGATSSVKTCHQIKVFRADHSD